MNLAIKTKVIFTILSALTALQTKASCQLIYNINGITPTAEKQTLTAFSWMAFKQGRILATGNQEITEAYKKCNRIDGNNNFLLPGIIDAHGHISNLGNEMLRVQLRDTRSETLAVEAVKKFAKHNQTTKWILGRGWNQTLWPEKSFPTAASLDASDITRPIVLERIDGHAIWVNSRALEIANITDSTPNPKGGKIERDHKGRATGVLIDNAANLVTVKIPKPSLKEQTYVFDRAFSHLLSLGITSVHDAGVNQLDLSIYKQRLKENQLPVRIYGMLSGSSLKLKHWLKQGILSDPEDRLSIRSVKLYADGALGSRGAALLAPYTDASHHTGLLLSKPEKLDQRIQFILDRGFQVNVHAIGDLANRLTLDAFEKAYKKVGGRALRNRIEHAQIISLDDIPRFNALNIIASVQPSHATSDKNMAEERLGAERLKGAYAWQKLIQQNTLIASGSDFPVELANPFYGLHAAVTRQDRNNQPVTGWLPEDRMTPSQALKSFTLNAAYAAHQEHSLGSIEAGKWADFILVDRDIINGKREDIWKTQVLQTWVAGKLKYTANH
ncbi:MAG: amidohydrolase [Gammaproteobacteria bacterium]|nr:amidohydrolase [Gammaproteobacteria bacterium]